MCTDLTIEELLIAWRDCRKRKRSKDASVAFEQNLSRNIMQLYRELSRGSYRPGRSTCFVVTHPKPREVWAADFRDRVVHHMLYNRIAPRFIRSFADDSCACLPGRGTLYAAQRLEAKIRRVTQNWTQQAYYLKCDFANFFTSIDKRVLDEQLARKVHEPWLLALARIVLHHDPRSDAVIQSPPSLMQSVPQYKSLFSQDEYHGLPIGNLSSQFFANVHLDELDQFALHQVRPAGYVRYVDDFILLHRCPQMLNNALARMERFAEERLGLRLNPKKTILQPVERGVDFVGHIIYPHHTRVRKRLLPGAVRAMQAADTREARRATANSYLGLMRQGKNFQHRRRVVKVARLLGHSHATNAEKVFAK